MLWSQNPRRASWFTITLQDPCPWLFNILETVYVDVVISRRLKSLTLLLISMKKIMSPCVIFFFFFIVYQTSHWKESLSIPIYHTQCAVTYSSIPPTVQPISVTDIKAIFFHYFCRAIARSRTKQLSLAVKLKHLRKVHIMDSASSW